MNAVKKKIIIFAILKVPTWQEVEQLERAVIEGSNRPREKVLLENSAVFLTLVESRGMLSPLRKRIKTIRVN